MAQYKHWLLISLILLGSFTAGFLSGRTGGVEGVEGVASAGLIFAAEIPRSRSLDKPPDEPSHDSSHNSLADFQPTQSTTKKIEPVYVTPSTQSDGQEVVREELPQVTLSHNQPVRLSIPNVVYGEVVTEVSELPPIQCSFETKNFPSYRSLIISEIAWMGGPESTSAEWIELKNASSSVINAAGYWVIDKDEQIHVKLPEMILEPGELLLLERGEEAVLDIDADLLYTGSLGNTNEALRVFDPWCNLIDEVTADPKWPAGSATTRRSMERSISWQWYTYSGTGESDVFGTPKAANSPFKEISLSGAPVLSTIISKGQATSGPSLAPIKTSSCTTGSVNLNTASQKELETITHIGPALAERIIAARPFSSVDELDGKVKGIGEKYLLDIKAEKKACID